MSNELFELCKQVYERTGYETGEWTNDSGGYVSPASDLIEAGIHFPLYTSDYLLEKLPPGLDLFKRPNSYVAIGPGDDPSVHQSDTPLKALLKLTIALDDAEKLKGDK